MTKNPIAFRTISEVARELDEPPHTLRFWESELPRVRPLRGRGGRRYYRPEDVAILQRTKYLLRIDGFTIKGTRQQLEKEHANGI